CPSCRRHLRFEEASCPFCGKSPVVAPAARPAQRARLSRSGMIAFGAVIASACGGDVVVDDESDSTSAQSTSGSTSGSSTSSTASAGGGGTGATTSSTGATGGGGGAGGDASGGTGGILPPYGHAPLLDDDLI